MRSHPSAPPDGRGILHQLGELSENESSGITVLVLTSSFSSPSSSGGVLAEIQKSNVKKKNRHMGPAPPLCAQTSAYARARYGVQYSSTQEMGKAKHRKRLTDGFPHHQKTRRTKNTFKHIIRRTNNTLHTTRHKPP